MVFKVNFSLVRSIFFKILVCLVNLGLIFVILVNFGFVRSKYCFLYQFDQNFGFERSIFVFLKVNLIFAYS